MPGPSKLSIATSVVQRLLKEEASYHKEQKQQEERIKKLQAGSEDENAEYVLKQEKQALEETKAVLPTVKTRIADALSKLEAQLESSKADKSASANEITSAEAVIAEASNAS